MPFLISLVITLLIVGIVYGALVWIINTAPIIPGEFKAIIKWILLVIVIIYLLGILLGMAPPVAVPWYRR